MERVLRIKKILIGSWLVMLLFLGENYASSLNFEFYDYRGKKYSLSELRGKYVLLNLFTSYCASCLLELNSLNKLNQKCSSSDLKIVSLLVNREASYLLPKLVNSKNLTYQVGIAPTSINRVFPDFSTVPTTYILNPQGRVVEKVEGYKNLTKWLGIVNKYVKCN